MSRRNRQTEYEATVCHGIEADDDVQIVTFIVGLHCTVRSYPGSFNPYDGGSPPEGPEFEPTYVYHNGQDIKWDGLVRIVGEDTAEKLFEDACIEATENGDF